MPRHILLRAVQTRDALMPGTPQFEAANNTQIPSLPEQAKFDDKTNLYHYEGMCYFSNALNNVVELQVGGSSKFISCAQRNDLGRSH